MTGKKMRNPIRLYAAMLVLALVAQTAYASSVIRSFTPRYSTTSRGELVLIGNANMSCPTGGGCAAARNGTGTNNNNNSYTMAYQNADSVATSPANSSTATLTIPGGSTVLFAGLYWGADTSAGSGGSAAPSAAARNSVRFATPAAAYASITASQVDVSGTRYAGFADVTSQVQAGGSGTYKVAGIQAGTGEDRYAGWSLVVVLRNPSLPPRNMVVFDGYANINSSNPTSVTTAVSGFRTPPTGAVTTQMGFVAYEGDLDSTGDRFQLNATNLSNAVNPADNAFNSTISNLGALVTSRNPNHRNNFGFDIDLFGTNVLGNNATSANLTFTTGGETYFPSVVTFQTDVFEPVILSNVTKTVSDVNGGTVQPGDVLEYTIGLSNTGNDGATQMVLTDPIPANTTYVPNSLVIASGANAGNKTDGTGDDQANFTSNQAVFRLGTGANATVGGTVDPGETTTARFRVTVNAGVADGTVISNQGTVNFVSETLNEAANGPTPVASVTVANVADLSITKTNTPASGPADQPADTVSSGTATTYTLRIVNAGPATVANAVVTDTPGAGITCPGALGSTVVACNATSSPAGATTCPGAGALTTANLFGGGIAIPSIAVSPNPGAPNNAVTLTFSCTVN
ncbi:DUF11 domain-containing protein [Luteimonas gilva]|uniref:DUF11 domain-containing protein n=2 Tax=Luteimonas gilva TaxID=2572684 RepID=A0A4U5JVY4_9GAMM|nr:DUF11 domain-containing protein [Luteimonas gilva]